MKNFIWSELAFCPQPLICTIGAMSNKLETIALCMDHWYTIQQITRSMDSMDQWITGIRLNSIYHKLLWQSWKSHHALSIVTIWHGKRKQTFLILQQCTLTSTSIGTDSIFLVIMKSRISFGFWIGSMFDVLATILCLEWTGQQYKMFTNPLIICKNENHSAVS